MITNLITQLNQAIARYKAKRVAATVDAYFDVVGKQINLGLPAVLGLYQHAAKSVVAKTYENPQVALDLLKAVQAAVDHYGPELTKALDEFKAEIEVAVVDPKSFYDAYDAMVLDTNADEVEVA